MTTKATAVPSAQAGVSLARRATTLACAAVSLIGLPVFAVAAEAKPKPKPARTDAAKTKPMPAWRKDMKVGVFSPIPGSSPSAFNLDPGYYEGRVFDDWCGLQIDEKHGIVYSALGGGHSSCEQNGVYKQDLMVDKPIWEVVRKSTRYVTGENGQNLYFPDGRPVARHTYYDGSYVDIGGKGMIIFVEVVAASPASTGGTNVDAFHIDTGDWDLRGSGWPPFPGAPRPANCVAKDPRTQNIWVADYTGGMYRFDPTTKQWTTITRRFNNWGIGYCGSIIDTKRDRFVFAGTYPPRGAFKFGGWSIAAGKYQDHLLTWRNGQPQDENLFAYSGLVHDTINDRYLWLGNSGKLRAVDPDTFTVTEVTQTTAGVNGVLNRFAFIEALRGCVFLAGWLSDMVFLPVE